MIRIAQEGWKDDDYATTLDEVVCGMRCMWVEIDGVRIPGILIGAWIDIGTDRFQGTKITLDVAGPVQLVYLDADGNELGAEPFDKRPAFFNHQTTTERKVSHRQSQVTDG